MEKNILENGGKPSRPIGMVTVTIAVNNSLHGEESQLHVTKGSQGLKGHSEGSTALLYRAGGRGSCGLGLGLAQVSAA